MNQTIGIIGGKGRMGSALAEFFQDQGFKVLLADRRTKLSNRELAEKSDVVIVSVNIDRTQEVIEEIASHLRKSTLLMDITSVKEMPVSVMLKTKAFVIGLHPMCNETTFGPGQTLIYCPERPGKWEKWLREVFDKKGGFKMIKLTPRRHDEMMSFVQALIHFSEFALGKTLKTINPKLADLLALASPASQLQLKIAARHLAQDPNLYGNIQIQNLRNAQILGVYQQAVDELYGIVKKGDLKAFTKYFNVGAKYFGDFGEQAFRETDGMIHRMIGEPAPQVVDKIPKDAIASLGPEGTFSAMATKKWRGKGKEPIVFMNSMTEIAQAVALGKAKFGVLPIENRLHGTVRETMDVLFKEKIFIVGDLTIPIHQSIVTIKDAKIKDIRTIMSHPQALNQCRDYLEKQFPNAKWMTTSSTAAAFEYLHKHRDPLIAAIGPEAGARHYDLKILKQKIENESGNETRFIVIARKPLKTSPKKNPRTSIVFYFSKDRPGSLLNVFQAFADLGVNLSRIESRPAPKKLGQYLFYLDFDESDISKNGKEALKRIKRLAGGVKVLGSY